MKQPEAARDEDSVNYGPDLPQVGQAQEAQAYARAADNQSSPMARTKYSAAQHESHDFGVGPQNRASFVQSQLQGASQNTTNYSNDYFLGQSPDHPAHLINKRVNAINDEIAKQRQYLPQFRNQNMAAVYSSQRQKSRRRADHADSASKLNSHGYNTGYGGSFPDAAFSDLRQQQNSTAGPRNFRDNLQELHEQQRVQVRLMDQAALQGPRHPTNKFKKHSFIEEGLFDHSQLNGDLPSSLGILRHARLGRPDLDGFNVNNMNHEFRVKTQTHHNMDQYRGGLERPARLAQIKSAHKASSKNILRAHERHVGQYIAPDRMGFDLNAQAAEDIQRYMQEQYTDVQKTPILKQSRKLMQAYNDAHEQLDGSRNQVRIAERDQRHRLELQNHTPMPKKKRTMFDAAGSVKGQSVHNLMNRTQQFNTSSEERMPGYVNYINGIPVEELSPHMVKGKKLRKTDKLPHIRKQNMKMTASSGPATRNSDLQVPNKETEAKASRLRKDQNISQSRRSHVHLDPVARQQQDRDYSRRRTHQEIVNDLEHQLGFTHDENVEALKKARQDRENAKKYATRKQKDFIAKNIGYAKTLSDNKAPSGSQQKLEMGADMHVHTHKPKSPEQPRSRRTLERIQLLKKDGKHDNKSKSIRKSRTRAQDVDAAEANESATEQINILIPAAHHKTSRSKDRKPSPTFNQNMQQYHQHQSLSPRKKQVKIHQSSSKRSLKKDRSNKSRSSSRRASTSSPVRGDHTDTHPRATGRTESSYPGFGPRNQKKRRKHLPNNLYDFDPKFFHKKKQDGPVLEIEIEKHDVDHLREDDLDELSRLEVTYKILKQQMREHQALLIEKRNQRKDEKKADRERQASRAKSGKKSVSASIDLNKFARHIKHFELYGSQRDVSPEIKRIVKNLMCQEHKFMYCPQCKAYDQMAVDPVDNIQKFMTFVRQEQAKLRESKRKRSAARRKQRKNYERALPHDSASDITDLEEEGILTKYLDERMTADQRKTKERKKVQKRLYGVGKEQVVKHICTTSHQRPASAEPRKTVKMELREVEDAVSMMDESNSAHQFSRKDMSVQADSDARRDAEMQTSQVDMKSVVNQTSKQDALSAVNQTSEIDYQSNQMNTSMYPPGCNKEHKDIQTDARRIRTPIKKAMRTQTVKAKDAYKEDWERAQVYRKALREEAERRGITFVDPVSEEEEQSGEDDSTTNLNQSHSFEAHTGRLSRARANHEENAQDPDTDANTSLEQKQEGLQGVMGFLKSSRSKGNIKMLSESEVQYVKKLLKQKNHDYWSDKSTLNDLHRHCKYTIRKLTQQMANIDNYGVFKHLKEPTREHTLYLVYRAERLHQALTDSQKIFKLVSQTIYDATQQQEIVDSKSIRREDLQFLKRRDLLFKRILTQMNTFLESYKLFNNQFVFKKMPLKDYLQIMAGRTHKARAQMEENRQNKPEEAAQEDEKLREEEQQKRIQKETFRNVMKEMEIRQEEELGSPASPRSRLGQVVKNEGLIQSRTSQRPAKDQLEININRRQEQDFVGHETLDLINKQADRANQQERHTTIHGKRHSAIDENDPAKGMMNGAGARQINQKTDRLGPLSNEDLKDDLASPPGRLASNAFAQQTPPISPSTKSRKSKNGKNKPTTPQKAKQSEKKNSK